MTRLCYHLFLTRLALPKSKSLLLFVSKSICIKGNEWNVSSDGSPIPHPSLCWQGFVIPPRFLSRPNKNSGVFSQTFDTWIVSQWFSLPAASDKASCFSCNLVSSLIPGNWMEAFCKTTRFLPFWVWPTDLVWYRWVWFRLSFTRPRFGKVCCAFLGNHCFFCQINRHRRMTRNVWQHSASKSLWTVWKRIVCLLISMTGGKRQGKEASYNGALSAARRDKKAWGRGVAMSIRDNFLIFAIFWHPPFTRRSHHQCRQWCWRYLNQISYKTATWKW